MNKNSEVERVAVPPHLIRELSPKNAQWLMDQRARDERRRREVATANWHSDIPLRARGAPAVGREVLVEQIVNQETSEGA